MDIHQAVGIAEGYIPAETVRRRVKSMATFN